MTPLQKAAQSVIDRWDSPAWKDQPHTAEYIAELRKALDAEIAQSVEPVAWIERDMQCDDFDPDSVTCSNQEISADGWEWVPLYLHPPQTQAMPPVPSSFQDEVVRLVATELYDFQEATRCDTAAQFEAQQATTPVLRECWYESDELKVCRKCGQLHDKAIATQGEKP